MWHALGTVGTPWMREEQKDLQGAAEDNHEEQHIMGRAGSLKL